MFKKSIILLLMTTLTQCGIDDNKEFRTKKFRLRQLIKETESKDISTTSFFLVGASHSEYNENVTTVKVFAKVGYTYRFIEMPIEDIRIRLDNNIKVPYIRIAYRNEHVLGNEWLLNDDWISKRYIITCPEKYLPEKLLPIEL